MLRGIAVIVLAILGINQAIKSPLGSLGLYLWLSYFRPEAWLWNSDFYASLQLPFIAGVFLVLRMPASDARFRLDLRGLLLLAFLGLSLVSTLLSQFTGYAWPFWVEFAKNIVVAFVITGLVTDVPRYHSCSL